MFSKLYHLEQAISEAERFLLKAKSAEKELQHEDNHIGPTFHFAAAKRSSMDLTRALARLRKSPYAD